MSTPTGLEAPSCRIMVLEFEGPEARRNIYATSPTITHTPPPPQPASPPPWPRPQHPVSLTPVIALLIFPSIIILLAAPTTVGHLLPGSSHHTLFLSLFPSWGSTLSKMWPQDSNIFVLQILGKIAVLFIFSLGLGKSKTAGDPSPPPGKESFLK